MILRRRFREFSPVVELDVVDDGTDGFALIRHEKTIAVRSSVLMVLVFRCSLLSRCYYVYTHPSFLLRSLAVTSFPLCARARARAEKRPIDFAISLKLNVAFAFIARAPRRNYAFAYAHTR